MTAAPLICHGASAPAAPWQLDAGVDPVREGLLHFHFSLRGDLSRLRLPAAAAGERRDGLWHHTCFEAFIRGSDGPAYVELNFSPSSCWAFYAFDAYRQGMRSPPVDPPVIVHARAGDDVLCLDATVPAAVVGTALPSGSHRLGLTAVVEDEAGHHTWWALAHPPGKPDFHHDAGLVMSLEGIHP